MAVLATNCLAPSRGSQAADDRSGWVEASPVPYADNPYANGLSVNPYADALTPMPLSSLQSDPPPLVNPVKVIEKYGMADPDADSLRDKWGQLNDTAKGKKPADEIDHKSDPDKSNSKSCNASAGAPCSGYNYLGGGGVGSRTGEGFEGNPTGPCSGDPAASSPASGAVRSAVADVAPVALGAGSGGGTAPASVSGGTPSTATAGAQVAPPPAIQASAVATSSGGSRPRTAAPPPGFYSSSDEYDDGSGKKEKMRNMSLERRAFSRNSPAIPDLSSCKDLDTKVDKQKMEGMAQNSEKLAAHRAPGGYCYRYVKKAIQPYIHGHYLPGVSAYMAHSSGYLKHEGFTDIMPLLQKCGKGNGPSGSVSRSVPLGAILVFSGGGAGHGHIEIRTQHGYCSDFCSPVPIDARINRKLIGVYVPSGGDAMSDAREWQLPFETMLAYAERPALEAAPAAPSLTRRIVRWVSDLMLPEAFSAAPECAGCATLSPLTEKFRKISPDDVDGQGDLLAQGAKAIAALPRTKGHWSAEQVHAISELMIAAYPYDGYFSLVENNYELFAAQVPAFDSEIARRSGRAAKELRDMVHVPIRENLEGNDPGAPSEPASHPGKAKSQSKSKR